MWKFLKIFLKNEHGGTVSGGQTVVDAEPVETPVEDGQGDGKEGDSNKKLGDGQGDAPVDGQGTQPPAQPKYGEYGDDPDKVWQAHNALKGKATATERNMAALRKSIEGLGVKVEEDGQGNYRFVPKEAKPTRQKRFNDEMRSTFKSFFTEGDDKFSSAIQAMIQDSVEDFWDNQQQTSLQHRQQQQQFQASRSESWEMAKEIWPEVNPDSESFNKKLHERADEILAEKYANDPNGDLKAVREAAKELGIQSRSVTQAAKAGFEKGKAAKTIVGPVNTSTGSVSSMAGKTLSKEEYFKLSSEDREKYDRDRVFKK